MPEIPVGFWFYIGDKDDDSLIQEAVQAAFTEDSVRAISPTYHHRIFTTVTNECERYINTDNNFLQTQR